MTAIKTKRGAAAPTPPDTAETDGPFLPARRVWERYGVTAMTLHRWLADDSMGFPPPVYIGRFRYFRLADLLRFEAQRPRRRRAEAA